MQIRTKLTLQFMAAVTLLILITFGVIYISSATYREKELYRRLDNKAQTSAELFVSVEQIDSTMLRLFDITQKDKLPMENISIYDFRNREVYTNNDSIEFVVTGELLDEIRLSGSKRFSQGELEVLGKVYEDRYHKFVIFAAAHDIYGLSKLKNLRNTLFVLFLSSISLTALAGWIYAGRALRPLSRVIKDVKRLDPDKLDMRLTSISQEDEIGRLIGTFNMLLERIEKAVNLQKLFITGASHELKNPLTAITSQLQVALLRDRSSAEYKGIISSILEDIVALNKTTNDLMEFARLSHEKQIAYESVRIDDVIWEAAEYFSKTKPSYKVEVKMDHLPEDENLLVVSGHSALLLVALVNLIDNACKFSRDHACSVILTGKDGMLQVSVRDNGPGIPEQLRPYIFEPFFRGDSTARSPGHGVGLALTSKILQLHGASLRLDTQVGQGCVFTAQFSAVEAGS